MEIARALEDLAVQRRLCRFAAVLRNGRLDRQEQRRELPEAAEGVEARVLLHGRTLAALQRADAAVAWLADGADCATVPAGARASRELSAPAAGILGGHHGLVGCKGADGRAHPSEHCMLRYWVKLPTSTLSADGGAGGATGAGGAVGGGGRASPCGCGKPLGGGTNPPEKSELLEPARRRRRRIRRTDLLPFALAARLIIRKKSALPGNVQAPARGHCWTSALPGEECQKPT